MKKEIVTFIVIFFSYFVFGQPTDNLDFMLKNPDKVMISSILFQDKTTVENLTIPDILFYDKTTELQKKITYLYLILKKNLMKLSKH